MSLPIEHNDLLSTLRRGEPDTLEKTKTFIAQNKNINNPKEYYEKVLHFAFMFGRFDSVTLLLEAGADKSSLGFSPIHEAIVWGTLQDVKKYLNSNSLEVKDTQECTPFLLAVKVGNMGKIKYLVEQGADIYVSTKWHHSALMYAVSNNDTRTLQYLLNIGLEIDGHNSDHQGTALYKAVGLAHIESVNFLLTSGAKLEYSYEYTPSRGKKITYRVKEKVISCANTMEVVNILTDAGAELKDIKGFMREKLLDLDFDAKRDITKEDYNRYKQKLFGESNPELMTNPFNLYMLKTNEWVGVIADEFDNEHKPMICYERFGRSITLLDDGRIIEIGGEHEDSYMPEFCIYNDVAVFYPDKRIEIYGYPKDIFPPTDSHTATLIGDNIYIIGNLGYLEARKYDTTPIYKLSIKDYSIQEIETKGKMPKWIHGHKASYDGVNSIIISGGTILQEKDWLENRESFVLNLEILEWKKI